MLSSNQLRHARTHLGWTQAQAASRLHVTQAYLSMLESGRRQPPPELSRRLAQVLSLPATALPLSPIELPQNQLAESLATLGYPGLRHLALPPASRRNPAQVLAAALRHPSLEARLAEALPWLALAYVPLDWDWLVREAKLHDFQNRLGYVVHLARTLARHCTRQEPARRLRDVERALEPSRLARDDSFAGERMTNAERLWLRRTRPRAARHWRMLTDMTAEQLHHAV